MARRLVFALALTSLLLPLVVAQVPAIPPGTPIDATQKPLALVPGADIADVRPLSGIGATNMSVQIQCVALSAQNPTDVALAVAAKPAWLSVTVTPATVQFPANAPNQAAPAPPCTAKMVQEVAILVSATADAPADTPGLIQITGTTTTAAGAATASGFLNATAAAFVAIDAGASKTNGVATPGAPWEFDVTVTNRGNAKAAVEFATFAARGIKVEAVGGEVGSRQAGDATNQQVFKVKVTPEGTVVNGAYPGWVNVTATVPGKAAVRPAKQNIAFTVNVEGAAAPPESEDDKSFLPTAFYAAPLGLGLAAIAARRRR